jgi:hypothetical protein
MCGEGEERGSEKEAKGSHQIYRFSVHPLAASIAQYLVFFFLFDSFLMSFFFVFLFFVNPSSR